MTKIQIFSAGCIMAKTKMLTPAGLLRWPPPPFLLPKEARGRGGAAGKREVVGAKKLF